MSSKYATPLLLEPGSSRTLCAGLAGIHAIAIILLAFMPLPVGAGWVILLLALFSLWQSIRRCGKPGPDSVCTVLWGEACACRLSLLSGQRIEAQLMPQVFMLPWLVILRLKSDRRQLHFLVLLPDMLEPGAFRRLRVRLMIGLNQSK